VQSPGLLTTVQDLGRFGYGPLGVSPCGAADPVALRLGNRLVGNPDSAPALEMTLLGGTFQFPDGAEVAVTGSDFGVPVWASRRIEPGETLVFGPTRGGARCYLCVRGGVAVPRFLGSASTQLAAGIGRRLRAGDVLPIGETAGAFRPCAVYGPPVPRKALRVTAGPQADWFAADIRRAEYRVTENSDRAGLRLAGPPVEQLDPARTMITEGVPLGAVQVPPGGQPIILFVDQQTTGGYPKIANVIAADVASAGQLRPRDTIRFEPVSPAEARALLIEEERILNSCIRSI
jgi:antagonist of KipI